MTTKITIVTEAPVPIERLFELARDIGVHERSLASSGEHTIGGRTSGPIALGETVVFRARYLGLWWTLESRVSAMSPPDRFVDEQVRGPFAWFRHEHRFETTTAGGRMIDLWEHGLRFGVLGRIADALLARRVVEGLLRRRAKALATEATGLS